MKKGYWIARIDVTDPEQVQRALDAAEADEGRLPSLRRAHLR